MASFVAPYLLNITLQTLVPRFQAGFVALICYKGGATIPGRIRGT